jgi:hypothetical protein
MRMPTDTGLCVAWRQGKRACAHPPYERLHVVCIRPQDGMLSKDKVHCIHTHTYMRCVWLGSLGVCHPPKTRICSACRRHYYFP